MPPHQNWPSPCFCDRNNPNLCEPCRRQQERTAFPPYHHDRPHQYDADDQASVDRHQRDFMNNSAFGPPAQNAYAPPPYRPMQFDPNTPNQYSLTPTIDRRQPSFPPTYPPFRVRQHPSSLPNGHVDGAPQEPSQSETPRETPRETTLSLPPTEEVSEPMRRFLEDRGIPVTRAAIEAIAAAARERLAQRRRRRQREREREDASDYGSN